MVHSTDGSFLLFLKIDQRPNGSILPDECCMRGLTPGAFFAAPAEMFEEGHMYRSLGSDLPVRRFFGKMRSRKRDSA